MQLFGVLCLLHVWPQPLFTAVSKYCSELRMTVPAPSVPWLEFVFNALAASPRAGDMGRGEPCVMGRRGERRGWGCNCHVYWFLQGEGGMLHLGCLHTLVVCVPLCSPSPSIFHLPVVSHTRLVAPWCLGWLCWCRAWCSEHECVVLGSGCAECCAQS